MPSKEFFDNRSNLLCAITDNLDKFIELLETIYGNAEFGEYATYLRRDYSKLIERKLENDYLKKHPNEILKKWVQESKESIKKFSNTYKPKYLALERKIEALESSLEKDEFNKKVIALRKEAWVLFTKAGEKLKKILKKMDNSFELPISKFKRGVSIKINRLIESKSIFNIDEDDLYKDLNIPDLKK